MTGEVNQNVSGGVERLRPPLTVTEDQVKIGKAALLPFVEGYGLSVNSENLELMAYAVLKYASEPDAGPPTEALLQRIDAEVCRLIEEESEAHQRMMSAMRASKPVKPKV